MRFIKNYIFAGCMIFLSACATKTFHSSQIKTYSNASIDGEYADDSIISATILPYKLKMEQQMNKVISYTPIDLDKNGFNSPLTNLCADLMLEEINTIYSKTHTNTKIDLALFNYGGLRRTFTKGPLTVGNIYELMPFDNEVIVADIKGETIKQMIDYLSKSDVGHPIAGFKFTPNKNDLIIGNQAFDPNKNYKIVTSDYLMSGGDDMFFLKNCSNVEVLNLKMRDVMLDYFSKHDTIQVNLDQRILK